MTNTDFHLISNLSSQYFWKGICFVFILLVVKLRIRESEMFAYILATDNLPCHGFLWFEYLLSLLQMPCEDGFCLTFGWWTSVSAAHHTWLAFHLCCGVVCEFTL